MSCTKLKVLRWKSIKRDRDEDWYAGFEIRGTPLENCRLDELYIEDPTAVIIDEAFIQILSQVKKLYLMTYVLSPRLWQILMAVRFTVQELHFTGTTTDNRITGNISPSDYQKETAAMISLVPIEMKQVIKFGTLWQQARDHVYITPSFSHRLALPQVTKAILRNNIVKWSDIGHFQGNLTYPECHLEMISDLNEINNNLHTLPKCESLVLTSESLLNMTKFWEAIKAPDENKRILPRLKHLKIAVYSSLLSANVISFVKFRIEIGFPMETVHIYCSSRFHQGSVACLRASVPDFSYSQSDLGRHFLQEE